MFPSAPTTSSTSAVTLSGNVSEQEKQRALDAFGDIVGRGTFGAAFGRKLQLVSVDEETELAEDGRFRAIVAKFVMDLDVEAG